MNTKAASVILWIFEVLAVVLMVVMVLQVSSSFAQGQAVQKINIAEDLVMMVEMVSGVPGDVVIEYPRSIKEYKFIVSPGTILVFLPGDTELQRVQRTFHLPENYRAEGFVDQEEHLCITKSGNKIILGGCL
ncbi:MAG: hypothetical protein Q8R37_00995 [Nanoarchaeota archaeon]|nr:hypothetical protein [Nanoarchaeota archaeon]